MNRIEIIYSQPLEEDILEAIKGIPEAKFFTIVPGVHGQGYSVPKMGDPVWPEVNNLMLIYCESDTAADAIAEGVDTVRQRYPNEGLALFRMKG